MPVVRFVLTALQHGVKPEDYERYAREVDYAVVARMKTILSYRTHRITEPVGIRSGVWDYIERIEIIDREAYERELATVGRELIDELYSKYLDRSKTVAIWSESIEP